MGDIVSWLHAILNQSPEIALFLSLAVGYWIGKFQFGKFQLGGVAGSLLVAVIISQIGISIDNGIKSVLFALFIYAVGFESGPQFFRSLGRQSIREIVMAAVLALPLGWVADRVGREKVFVGGYLLLLGVYALLLTSDGGFAIAALLLLFGAYYAATDGVLAAASSAILRLQ